MANFQFTNDKLLFMPFILTNVISVKGNLQLFDQGSHLFHGPSDQTVDPSVYFITDTNSISLTK